MQVLQSLYGRSGRIRYAPLGLLLTLIGLVACTATPTPTPAPVVLQVGVTDLTQHWMMDALAAYAAEASTVEVQLVPVARGRVAEEIRAGHLDLAILADPGLGLWAAPVGSLAVDLVVNRSNPLEQLTITQTQAIFSGTAVDWAQVGVGTGGMIQVVAAADEADLGRAFAALVLNGSLPTRTGQLAPTASALRELVSENPLAVGYVPHLELDDTVKALTVDPPLRVSILAVAAAEPQGAARVFLAWLQHY